MQITLLFFMGEWFNMSAIHKCSGISGSGVSPFSKDYGGIRNWRLPLTDFVLCMEAGNFNQDPIMLSFTLTNHLWKILYGATKELWLWPILHKNREVSCAFLALTYIIKSTLGTETCSNTKETGTSSLKRRKLRNHCAMIRRLTHKPETLFYSIVAPSTAIRSRNETVWGFALIFACCLPKKLMKESLREEEKLSKKREQPAITQEMGLGHSNRCLKKLKTLQNSDNW